MFVKDKLYYILVNKNRMIEYEYQEYVDSNIDEHKNHRLKHWILLFKLNWHYRILRKKTLYLQYPAKMPIADNNADSTADAHSRGTQSEANVKDSADNRGKSSDISTEKRNEKILPKTNSDPQNTAKSVNTDMPGNSRSSSPAPYVGNIEAAERKISTPYAFARDLMQYDVISFDIFDTLILRRLNDPRDLFALVGNKLGVFDFYSVRIKAEREVRDEKSALLHNRECTLEEIYKRIEYYTGIDAKKGMDAELEAEFDMCFGNPYMIQMFSILRSQKKTVFAVSNMYLSKEIMCRLLEKCGFNGFEDILVSCDYECGKGNGALFRVLLTKTPKGSRIVHIGDNISTDINGARSVGITAKHYKACRDLGLSHRSRGMSSMIGSAYFAAVNNRLHCGIDSEKTHSKLWEYGFVYGGIIAVGYAAWIHKRALEHGITKILFLSRDGYILNKVFNMLYDDIDTEYTYWSRIAAIRNTSAGERNTLLSRIFTEPCGTGVTIEQCLELLGIPDFSSVLEKKGIDVLLPLQIEYSKKICSIIVENWSVVEKKMKKIKNATSEYIRSIVSGHSNIGIVDMGWSGKSDLPLTRIIRETGEVNKCKIFMLGSIFKWENISGIMSDDIECYMFGPHCNREIYEKITSMCPASLEIMEKLFNAPSNSFLGINENGEMEFSEPEVDNYQFFSEVEKGILDFSEQYIQSFRKYPLMFNISGYDAYVPIRMVFNNKKYQHFIFDGTTFHSGLFTNNRKSMKDIL